MAAACRRCAGTHPPPPCAREDEGLYFGEGRFVHPTFSTVTYLTARGAPTLILQHTIEPSGVLRQRTARRAFLSAPRCGKHIRFDGALLHAVPAALAPTTGDYTRITFAVNVWLNRVPAHVRRFPYFNEGGGASGPPPPSSSSRPGGEGAAATAAPPVPTAAPPVPSLFRAARRPTRASAAAARVALLDVAQERADDVMTLSMPLLTDHDDYELRVPIPRRCLASIEHAPRASAPAGAGWSRSGGCALTT